MIQIHVGSVPIVLHHSGAAFQASAARLFVADLHLGKGGTLRAAGLPIPGGTSRETMARVDDAIQSVGTARIDEVWVLGDLVHARAGITESLTSAVGRWIETLPGGRLHLVRGNHDRGAGDLPWDWRIAVHEEPHVIAQGAHPLTLRHEPRDDGPPHLAGHLHPTVRPGTGRARGPKVPAFVGRVGEVGDVASLVLPALGRLVDGAVVRGRPGWRAWACGEGEVLALPTGSW